MSNQIRHAPDIDDLEIGVRRGLRPDETGLGPDGGVNCLQVAHVDQGVVDPVTADDPRHEAMRTAVGVVGKDDVVAGGQQVRDVLCSGQAAGVGKTPGCPFERGHHILQRGARWVVGAAVLVRAQIVDPLLHEGARLVDRGGDRARGGIRLLPGVDSARLESGLLPIGGHA
jgi:hypothetical protein